MSDYSDRSVCVVDFGLFADFATTLAQSFGRTYLYVPWESSFPTRQQLMVGAGLEGVTKVESLWEVLDATDLFVFPDVALGPLQEHLVSLGKRVWGSRMGEAIEQDREESKRMLKARGLAIGAYEVVVGLKALRAFLKTHRDQFVKVSRTRGNFETFKSETYTLVEPRLDELEYKLGPEKEDVRFIVEAAIDDAVEVAYDGYAIDGRYPARAMVGIEVKDRGYLGCMQEARAMPAGIRTVNEAVASLLEGYQYRNFWAAEARITRDGTPWVIDPCARAGSPPSEVLRLQYTNLADILWHGAAGDVVDPVPRDRWGAEVLITSSRSAGNFESQWEVIDFPMKIREHLSFRFPMKLHDRYYVNTGGSTAILGAVSAVGPTRKAVVREIETLCKQVGGYYVECDTDALEEAEGQIAELEEFGITLAPEGSAR